MSVDFAILAPVPVEHLTSALDVLAAHDHVSFGSNKFETFRSVDDRRGGAAVPVLIYPSHEGVAGKLTFEVRWVAEYVGHVEEARLKALDEAGGHRPRSTEAYRTDNAAGWGVFWQVRGLAELAPERRCAIGRLESYGKEFWRKNAAPRGPEVVRRPVGF